MKTILVPTDFSANATHAAKYAYQLATQIRANIILCNAVIIPAEIPEHGFTIWPTDESEMLMAESGSELRLLRHRLNGMENGSDFHPQINITNTAGTVTSMINEIISDQVIDMVVIGSHTEGGLSSLITGNHANRLIDNSIKPLLIVPKTTAIKFVRKIAFATDFSQPAEDLQHIYKLITYAKSMDAEIVLTHVHNDKRESHGLVESVSRLIVELSNKADYPHIYYHLIKDNKVQHGLDFLCKEGNIDMLAMVHRQYNLLTNLVSGSHTQKMASSCSVPLLVFPSKS